MPTVRFIREGIEVDVDEGANLRDVAREVGVEVYPKPFSYGLNCHGWGHCGTCRVYINPATQEGASDLSFWEKLQFYTALPFSFSLVNFFDFIGHEDELRLSCQVTVEDDIEVYTRPAVNWYGDPRWQYDVDNPALAGHASLSEGPPQTPFEEGEMQELEDEES